MNKLKNSPDKKPIGALSATALMAFLLNACAGGAGNIKAPESVNNVDDIDAFIEAAAKSNDAEAIMKGLRMKLAALKGFNEDFYEFNGVQDDGTVIECATSGTVDGAQNKAGAKARRVFMEMHRNPDVRVLVEDLIGGKLSRKIVSGDASGIKTPAPYAQPMANGRYVRCSHAQEANGKREKKEKKSRTRGAKGDR